MYVQRLLKYKTRLAETDEDVSSQLNLGLSPSRNQPAASQCFGAKKQVLVTKQIVQQIQHNQDPISIQAYSRVVNLSLPKQKEGTVDSEHESVQTQHKIYITKDVNYNI